jgi:hypothetical protein
MSFMAADAGNNPRHRKASNEEVIREELRAIVGNFMDAWRAGVALLSSMSLAIFYIRRQVYEQMLETGELNRGQYLPWDRYILGTLFLLVVASMFYGICRILGNRYRWYADLLNKECDNPIALPPVSPAGLGRKLFFGVFFIFPLFDFALRVWIRLEIGLR